MNTRISDDFHFPVDENLSGCECIKLPRQEHRQSFRRRCLPELADGFSWRNRLTLTASRPNLQKQTTCTAGWLFLLEILPLCRTQKRFALKAGSTLVQSLDRPITLQSFHWKRIDIYVIPVFSVPLKEVDFNVNGYIVLRFGTGYWIVYTVPVTLECCAPDRGSKHWIEK